MKCKENAEILELNGRLLGLRLLAGFGTDRLLADFHLRDT
jgi:hypothetical protein